MSSNPPTSTPSQTATQGTPYQQPTAAAPTAMVFHDVSELDTHLRNHVAAHRPTVAMTVSGIWCSVRKPTSEVVAAFAPPYSALMYKYRGCDHEQQIVASGFTADHYFVRRQPRPDEPAANGDVVKQVYNMCEGCVARGWHLPETDISSAAYGVEMPDEADF